MDASYGLRTFQYEAVLHILLSILAFFLSFVALWCAASVQTRIHRHVEDDGNARAIAVEAALGELANRVQALQKRHTKLENTLTHMGEARAEDSRNLAILERRARQHDDEHPAGHDREASNERRVA